MGAKKKQRLLTRTRRTAMRKVKRWLRKPFIQRQAAALWMNCLIGSALTIAFFTVWGGFGAAASSREVAVAALKVFAVWALSFLPGWLYIRFLGQRAGALMSEYVLNLHRLGWDEPQFLPEPLAASPYWEVWHEHGGEQFRTTQNVYLQKFNAYYGRATTNYLKQHRDEANFRVRIDTLFPVFVTTATLAVGWIAVLWDTSFLSGAKTPADVLKFAFLGAYTFIAQDLIRRFFQSDLRPSAYAAALLRIAFVLMTTAAVIQLTGNLTTRMQATIAFVVGIVPVVALQALQRVTARVLKVVIPQAVPEYPLSDLTGLNIWHEARLVEEGIEDMQNLATANLVDVILHTRIPVGRVMDWIDQASLALRLPSRRVENEYAEKPFEEQQRDVPLTRRMLEHHGIRTATDLLKAWPAAPLAGIPGLPPAETAVLVRVLERDTRITAIWNWQARGVARREALVAPAATDTGAEAESDADESLAS